MAVIHCVWWVTDFGVYCDAEPVPGDEWCPLHREMIEELVLAEELMGEETWGESPLL